MPQRAFASEEQPSLPKWLRSHIGDGEGQIAEVVLERARALYFRKLSEGRIKNPCYFAMDATRPHDLGGGQVGRRFYIICEASHSYQAISAGHGGGRNLEGIADFENGRQCAKNFGNAMDSKLTAGGNYITDRTKTSFKGYYQISSQRDEVLNRSFILFEGDGETANAKEREIGGHAAVSLKKVCLRKEAQSPHADRDGYVPFGKLTDYTAGRSDGCTSWSPADAQKIISMVSDDPTTLYIYPEAADIDAVAEAVAAGQSLSRARLYWNTSCLNDIGVPKFWAKETLEPILTQFEKDHPPPPQQPTPICKAR
ncbi:hypothetical protein [Hyphomicrobium sp. 802]|uniref:hypothetical protein n=1 Tax=Hyphomicrobium sp. 802 TaxID=1112272 RepID=UPI001FDA0BC0|nr:hypothetical protein [Hyphomicrobium sp. 802]